jgi:hypothetical protein
VDQAAGRRQGHDDRRATITVGTLGGLGVSSVCAGDALVLFRQAQGLRRQNRCQRLAL